MTSQVNTLIDTVGDQGNDIATDFIWIDRGGQKEV